MANQWSYIIAAYVLTWVTLGGYAMYLWRRHRRALRLLNDVAPEGPGVSRRERE